VGDVAKFFSGETYAPKAALDDATVLWYALLDPRRSAGKHRSREEVLKIDN
jgi:hypothetical protein